MRKFFLVFLLVFFSLSVKSQIVYEHISNTAIYNFLDELSVSGAIVLNAATKPFPRTFIAQKLLEAQSNQDKLTLRQQKEIAFYLLSFRVDLPQLFDSKFEKLRTPVS